MFEAVRKNKRIAQIVLGVVILPFAFFGMDSYFSDGRGGVEVAKIGGASITSIELEQAMRERQDRVRQASGGQVDPALFATREFRRAVLETRINERAIDLFSSNNRLAVTSQQLQEVIATQPAFQVDGQFSRSRYENVLGAQGMSPAMFENGLVQDIRTQQIVQAIGQSAFAGTAAVRRLVDIQVEQRVLSELAFDPKDFEAQVTLSEAAAQEFYRKNATLFVRPPRLRAEYVVLDRATLTAGISVDDAKVQVFYDGNQTQYGQPEERRARHILVRASASAPEAEVAAAREQAAALLEKVRAAPDEFEAIARESSQDPGSARNGGDLGFFGPGVMVPAFEEVVFNGEVGEISDLVQTDFGFHIIQVTEVKAGTVRPLAEVRDEIVEQLRSQEVTARFPLLAEQFANAVYEQPDSLEPAADALGLELRKTDWINREDGSVGGFNDSRLMNALFAPETRASGDNVEAIEVERGTLIAARVAEYEEAAQLSFDDVREEIERQLRYDEAAKLARVRGEEALAKILAGESAPGKWSEPLSEMRGSSSLPPQATRAVFTAPVDTLPAYVGVQVPGGGYSVFRIESVERPELTLDDPRVAALAEEYDSYIAELELTAFIKALRDEYGVEIRAAALETPEN